MQRTSTRTLSTPRQIIQQLRQCLPGILQNHPVMIAYVYGSVATGAMTSLSDVDIALVLNPEENLSPYQRFMLELEIEVAIENHCRISNADVRSIDNAPLSVQGQVVTEGSLLFSKDEDFRVQYEVQTRKRYFDFEPVLQQMQQAFFQRMEEKANQRNE